MTVATVYGSLTADQASVKPDGNPVCTSLHYPRFSAGQTEASELIDLPKVTQLVGLEARINTQMCLVPEPSWGHQALKLGAKGRRVGGGGWKGWQRWVAGLLALSPTSSVVRSAPAKWVLLSPVRT